MTRRHTVCSDSGGGVKSRKPLNRETQLQRWTNFFLVGS